MFGKLAMRGIAVLHFLLPALCGGMSQAFAQYQINADGGAVMAPLAPALTVAEPFGLKTVPVTGGGLLAKWDGVTDEIRAESDVLARCREHARSAFACDSGPVRRHRISADGDADATS